MELTWNRGRTEPYDNAGKDAHGLEVPDYQAAHDLRREKMGCILRDNPALGVSTSSPTPSLANIEILPARD